MIVEDESGNDIDLHDLDRPEPSEPDEPAPLDLDEVDRHYRVALAEDLRQVPENASHALAAVPELLARLRAAEAELAEWRGREHRYEYGLTLGEEQPLPIFSQAAAQQAWEGPSVGTPWHRYEPPPF